MRSIRTSMPEILCFHAISDTWKSALAVSVSQFTRTLERYAERGYIGLTFAEAERRRSDETLPPRTLVVTFDDGFASVRKAEPVLRRLGMPATVFVVGAFVSGERPLEWPGITGWLHTQHRDELLCLTEHELRQLRDDGWEIASHSMSHPILTAVAPDRCLHELVSSRAVVTEMVGGCDTVAYPYGAANRQVAALARRAGYLAGCTLTLSHRWDEPLLRPRVAIVGTDSQLRSLLKTSPLALALRRTLPNAVLHRIESARLPT